MEHAAQVKRLVEAKQQRYVELANEIWSYAEMRYSEYRSAELHAALLEEEGFRVTRGVAGLPTAFVAEAGSGGPLVGFLGEYDALAGLSQESGALVCVPAADGVNTNGHG